MVSTFAIRPLSLFDSPPSPSTPSAHTLATPHYRKRSDVSGSRPNSFYHRASSPPRSSTIPSPYTLDAPFRSRRTSMGVKDLRATFGRARSSKMPPPETPTSKDHVRPNSPECAASHAHFLKKSMKRQASLPMLRNLSGRTSTSSADSASTSASRSPLSELASEPWTSADGRQEESYEERNNWHLKRGLKYHPYPDEAPYMSSYEPMPLENDHCSETLLRRLNPTGTPSFIEEFKRFPPSRILDLGCGPGRWVMEAAAYWKNNGTTVTGFDLVPDELWHSDKASAENIKWVRGNFIKYRLPFPNASFDLVRMANLSLAIPFDRWSFVLDEVWRVLSPSGRLELIDDSIFFPYAKNLDRPPPTASYLASHPQRKRRPTPNADFDPESETEEAQSTGIDSGDKESSDQVEPTSQVKDEANHAVPTSPLEDDVDESADTTLVADSLPDELFIKGESSDVSVESGVAMEAASVESPVSKRDSNTTMVNSVHSGDESDATKAEPEAPSSETCSAEDDDQSKRRMPVYTSEEWDRCAESSKELETIFERMLWAKFGVHPRPSEIIDDFLAPPFGPTDFRKLHMFNVALAPEKPSAASKRNSGSSSSVRSTDTATKKGWMTIEWDKKDAKKRDSLGHVPDVLSAKAARQLGIDTFPANSKAARQLGSNAPYEGPPQCPGLYVWPATFIPIPPAELEMHACKNVHLLLSCRSALYDYVQEFKDEVGKPLVSEEEFMDQLWEYECFRRGRFSWSSEPPALDLLNLKNAESSAPPTPTTFASSAVPDLSSPFFGRPRSGSGSKTFTPTAGYTRDELTFVRKIQVYEAYKTSD
ncbi:hypothetical protein PLICRDRAFT_171659 [Plicaturopsis crispa FD-325 SS-3]|nr:hypothetical protein PLICRDRAFT_171659 [Plicaturopsis crispa FD-325 SS-3]